MTSSRNSTYRYIMLDVQLILKALSHPSQKILTGRQAFKNYLMCQPSEDLLLDSDSINKFFFEALMYPHWQQNSLSLTKEIKSLLEELNSRKPFSLNWEDIIWPNKVQVFNLKHTEQINDVLQAYYNDLKVPEYKLINDTKFGLHYCIILQPNREMIVHQHNSSFWLQHGKMEPLKKHTLYYTDDLELDPTRLHTIEIAPFTTAQWTEIFQGSIYKGYMFEKVQTIRGRTPLRLFHSIKRAEQFFLSRKSDPFYEKTTRDIEKSIQLIKIKDPQAQFYASQVLAEAQNALECVFVDDKILELLIRDLSHHVQINDENLNQELNEWKQEKAQKNNQINKQKTKTKLFQEINIQPQLENLELLDSTSLLQTRVLAQDEELIDLSRMDTLPSMVKEFLS